MTENNNVFSHVQGMTQVSEIQEVEDPTVIISPPLGLSVDQEKVLASWMIVAGCLSTIGSLLTLYRIFKCPKSSNSYDRIMVGLSFFNMISAISYIMTPFLLPSSDDGVVRVWSTGNQVTCSFLGWLTQLSFASVSYTCALCFYFLAAIKFRIHMEDFSIRFEAFIHGLTIFFFLFTATAGVPLQMYDQMDIGMSCWIRDDFPKNCKVDGDDTGCVGNAIGWFLGGGIVFVAFAVLFVIHTVVWLQIRSKLEGVRRRSNSEWPTWAIRIRRSSTQLLMFVLAFYLTNTTPVILRILEQRYGYNDASREADLYGFLVANSLLAPLQGFLNTFIHARPNYLKLRASEYPMLVAFWLAVWHNNVDEYVDGGGGESMMNPSSGTMGSKSKEDEILTRLENSIRVLSEHVTEEMSYDQESEWGLQALRQLSVSMNLSK